MSEKNTGRKPAVCQYPQGPNESGHGTRTFCSFVHLSARASHRLEYAPS